MNRFLNMIQTYAGIELRIFLKIVETFCTGILTGLNRKCSGSL